MKKSATEFYVDEESISSDLNTYHTEYLKNLEGTNLPNSHLFKTLRISNGFLRLNNETDRKTYRGALKSAIFGHTSMKGLSSGTITDFTSQTLLASRLVVSWLREQGISPMIFRGVHTQTFFSVSSGRQQMSVDMYIDHFIPKLVHNLGCVAQVPGLCKEFITQAIIFPLFQTKTTNRCPETSKIITEFTSANRGFFAKR
ncbi:hypothetical protein FBUS_00312 [Fasciolopsis buskii]|uniref:Uncharacterized protein n=1 Tax=Fasciolopsis buskii TaxID=27845 RepID=A0A8E0RUS2_9TREM|nr:hypothetical protein FBUS_00312 [Fasciolopsis buski]